MRVIIVEDEILAAGRLEDLLTQYDPDIEVVAQPDSIEEAVEWFRNNDPPELAFFDIQLADGLSFRIFDQVTVSCPVIFTTAYDTYALQAFKVNSIDYLLKPVDLPGLEEAFRQYRHLKKAFSEKPAAPELSAIKKAMQMMSRQYKSRFIVKAGYQLLSVPIEETTYFYYENRVVWLKQKDGKKHAVDYTLDQLEEVLDPSQFFRLNRQFITSHDAIEEVVSFSNSRLKVALFDMPREELILVSRERVPAFKDWLDGI